MNKAVPIVLGAIGVGGLIFALSRKASGADNCRTLQANTENFFIYTGPAKSFE